MRINAYILFLVVTLCLTTVLITKDCFVSAIDTSTITIQNDGSVNPSSAPIQRSGNTYTLTANITGIEIACNNIILDGAGYTTQGQIFINSNYATVKNFNVVNVGSVAVRVDGSHNVIENSHFDHNGAGMSIKGGYNTIVRNNVTSGLYPIIYINSNNNLITQNLMYGIHIEGSNNIITENTIYLIEMLSSNNTFYKNNFYVHNGFASAGSNAFDYNGTGNFWSDYNGTDANGDGIGDTTYNSRPKINDLYPLMKPYNVTASILASETTPTPDDSLTPSLTIEVAIAVAVICSVSIIGVYLIRQRKKD